tara:strand:- start:21 stop:344 length:324 start_codon:yes stop_codon:yes gene_type:complete
MPVEFHTETPQNYHKEEIYLRLLMENAIEISAEDEFEIGLDHRCFRGLGTSCTTRERRFICLLFASGVAENLGKAVEILSYVNVLARKGMSPETRVLREIDAILSGR